jgi:hypothetical protein
LRAFKLLVSIRTNQHTKYIKTNDHGNYYIGTVFDSSRGTSDTISETPRALISTAENASHDTSHSPDLHGHVQPGFPVDHDAWGFQWRSEWWCQLETDGQFCVRHAGCKFYSEEVVLHHHHDHTALRFFEFLSVCYTPMA